MYKLLNFTGTYSALLPHVKKTTKKNESRRDFGSKTLGSDSMVDSRQDFLRDFFFLRRTLIIKLLQPRQNTSCQHTTRNETRAGVDLTING